MKLLLFVKKGEKKPNEVIQFVKLTAEKKNIKKAVVPALAK